MTGLEFNVINNIHDIINEIRDDEVAISIIPIYKIEFGKLTDDICGFKIVCQNSTYSYTCFDTYSYGMFILKKDYKDYFKYSVKNLIEKCKNHMDA